MAAMAAMLLAAAAGGASPSLASTRPKRERLPDDPVGVLRWIYDAYPLAIEQYGRLFSKRLATLLGAALKKSNELSEPVSGLDFDFTTNSQDVEKGFRQTLELELVSRDETKARVRVAFRNVKVRQELFYDLVHEDKQWRIDEVTAKGRDGWVLSQLYETGAKGE